jgi:hypothetical protein
VGTICLSGQDVFKPPTEEKEIIAAVSLGGGLPEDGEDRAGEIFAVVEIDKCKNAQSKAGQYLNVLTLDLFPHLA